MTDITLSCGTGGSKGLWNFTTQDGSGGNGTPTVLYSDTFFDYALGGYGGGAGQNIAGNPPGGYGGGGAGVGGPGGIYDGGIGVGLAFQQYQGLAAAGGGGGQGGNWGGGGGGYAINGIAPASVNGGQVGNGDFLFARFDGAGDVGGIGGTASGSLFYNFGYGGGGGGIACTKFSSGGNGGTPGYFSAGGVSIAATDGSSGVSGGGGGGGGGGFNDNTGNSVVGQDGGSGGDGAGRFVFTSLENSATVLP
jgi:hypothetical protein